MATVEAFPCLRPAKELAGKVAALPYDVYNRAEATDETRREPFSFLKIDRAETQFEQNIGTYDPEVYAKAKDILDEMVKDGIYKRDCDRSYYIYRLTMDNREQTGIAATVSLDDFFNNVIKKHENTREEKEMDRITHINTLNAQTGPIFLAYRNNAVIHRIVDEKKQEEPLYDFIAVDGIKHTIWKVDDKDRLQQIKEAFDTISNIYIADGHHRAASAVKVGLKRRKEHPDYTGKEEFNSILSVLFPDDQLMIMSYNRCVSDLNGLSAQEFLKQVEKNFTIQYLGKNAQAPDKKGSFSMFLEDVWYMLETKSSVLETADPVKSLDVSILQDYILEPILGILDPRIDKRIDFIGGIRGLLELEKRAKSDMKVSFAMYPTSIGELFDVADAGLLMPPKSTWFEPKLRSGIFIHEI